MVLNCYLNEHGQENRITSNKLTAIDIEDDSELIPSSVLKGMSDITIIIKEFFFHPAGWR